MPPPTQRRNAPETFGLRCAERKVSMPSAGLRVPLAHGTWRPQARTICTLWKAGVRSRIAEVGGRQLSRDLSPSPSERSLTLAIAGAIVRRGQRAAEMRARDRCAMRRFGSELPRTDRPHNYQVQRRNANVSARGRAATSRALGLGRPRPSTLCVPDRCNAELGGRAGALDGSTLAIGGRTSQCP
jgi:hypothetical protein